MQSAELEAYIARLPPDPQLGTLFRRWGIRYRWYAVLTISMGNIAAVLSSTIINVAIPDIMGAFGIGQDEAQWLATANLAAATISMLLSAWLVDRFGLRLVVFGAMAVFLAGSVCGGLATNVDIMIISRMLQGVTAGLLMPLSMSMIFHVFPRGQQGTAMGVSAVTMILAPAVGPALGGLLVDALNWRYVFFLGVPFSVLTIAGAELFLSQHGEETPSRFDWYGLILLTITTTATLVCLSNGERKGWDSDFTLINLGIALAAGAAFLRWESSTPHPLLDLGLFAGRDFLIICINVTVFFAGMYASTYLVPLFLQLVQHFTPTRSGVTMIPSGIAMLLLFPIAGKLAESMDHRLLISIGIVFFALSFALMSSADADTSFWHVALWLVLGRVGISLVMPAMQISALSGVEAKRLTRASGAFNFVRQMGGVFGVNLISVTLDRRQSWHLDYLLSTQTWGNTDTMQILGSLQGFSRALGFAGTDAWNAGMAMLQGMVHREALAAAFRDCFTILAIVFALAIIPTLMLRGSRASRRPPAPAAAAIGAESLGT